MNKNKIGSLLAYISFAIPEINLRKLIKIVYLIDERSVVTRGLSVTWLEYYVWEKVPVAPCIYDIKNKGGEFARYITAEKNEEEKYIVQPVISRQASMMQFSAKELLLIDSILDEYGHFSADELTEITHCAGGLWDKAKKTHRLNFEHQKKTDVRIELSDLIMEDEDKMGVYEDAREIVLL